MTFRFAITLSEKRKICGRGHSHLTCLVVVEGDGGDAVVALVALRRVCKRNKVWESARELGGV